MVACPTVVRDLTAHFAPAFTRLFRPTEHLLVACRLSVGPGATESGPVGDELTDGRAGRVR